VLNLSGKRTIKSNLPSSIPGLVIQEQRAWFPGVVSSAGFIRRNPYIAVSVHSSYGYGLSSSVALRRKIMQFNRRGRDEEGLCFARVVIG
jgi:hypothetical protein